MLCTFKRWSGFHIFTPASMRRVNLESLKYKALRWGARRVISTLYLFLAIDNLQLSQLLAMYSCGPAQVVASGEE